LQGRREAAVAAARPAEELGDQRALVVAAEVRQALVTFAGEAGMQPPALEIPEQWQELHDFEKAARRAVTQMRGEMPDSRRQQDLYDREKKVLRLRTDHDNASKELEAITRGVRELDKEHGGRQAVSAKRAKLTREIEEEQARLRNTDSRVALLMGAIDYLEEAEGEGPADVCPVCEHKAPRLLAGLRARWEKSRQAEVNAI